MNDLVPVRRALLSVSDKTDLVALARGLHELGVELLSTGGSAAALAEASLPVRTVESATGSPEMLGGRVKTLHPKIHGGILARRDIDGPTLCEHGIEPIDLVCVNLYPFEETVRKPGVTLEQAIEQIDIGGPSMIRSAAKNAAWVVCLTEPAQYERLLAELKSHGGATTLSHRRELARAAFQRTNQYDAAIARYLTNAQGAAPETDAGFPDELELGLVKQADLRYGENPHQQAAVYRSRAHSSGSVIGGQQLHGKALSYNNVLDASAALRLVRDLHTLSPSSASAAVVKHTNPCGAAIGATSAAALHGALEGDPLAAFGGIVALSRRVDLASAQRLAAPGAFFEVVVAPGYDDEALELLRTRFANVRLIATGELDTSAASDFEVRTVPGGALVQRVDAHVSDPSRWTHSAGPKPSEDSLRAAAFLDTASRSLTSNAVAIGGLLNDGTVALAGAGAGQMDRVASCRIAIEKAGERCRGGVAASDAFFPFADGPTLLADAGIAMIVHPGGSKRDSETFELCESRGICCMTTGVRRFRH